MGLVPDHISVGADAATLTAAQGLVTRLCGSLDGLRDAGLKLADTFKQGRLCITVDWDAAKRTQPGNPAAPGTT